MAAVSAALANDLDGGFVAFLALLLAIMLAAVMRMPGPDSSPSPEEDAGPQPVRAENPVQGADQ